MKTKDVVHNFTYSVLSIAAPFGEGRFLTAKKTIFDLQYGKTDPVRIGKGCEENRYRGSDEARTA